MTYTLRIALTGFSWFINVNIIKRNKVSGLKSWLAFPRGGGWSLVHSPVIFWYQAMHGKDRKEYLYTIWKIIRNPRLHKYKYVNRQHNSLHIGKEELQIYTVRLKRHQFNQKDLFPTSGRRKMIINGVKSTFVSLASRGKNAGERRRHPSCMCFSCGEQCGKVSFSFNLNVRFMEAATFGPVISKGVLLLYKV